MADETANKNLAFRYVSLTPFQGRCANMIRRMKRISRMMFFGKVFTKTRP